MVALLSMKLKHDKISAQDIKISTDRSKILTHEFFMLWPSTKFYTLKIKYPYGILLLNISYRYVNLCLVVDCNLYSIIHYIHVFAFVYCKGSNIVVIDGMMLYT